MKAQRPIVLFIVLLVVAYGCLIFQRFNQSNNHEILEIVLDADVALKSDLMVEENIEEISLESESDSEIKGFPFGIIVENQLISDDEKIEEFYEDLKGVVKPSVIVLIDYDPGRSESAVVCTKCQYLSDFGTVKTNMVLAERILKNLSGEVKDVKELSSVRIRKHTDLIAKNYPESDVLPIVMGRNAGGEFAVALAEWFDENLPQGAVVVLNLSAMQDVGSRVAAFQEKYLLRVLKNRAGVSENLNVNCRACLNTFLRTMKLRNYSELQTLENGIKIYVTGESQVTNGFSAMLFGKVSRNYEMDFVRGFDFNLINDRNTIFHYFRDLQGVDGAFLKNVDLFIFDVKSGCHKEKFNDLVINICGMSSEEDEVLLEEIEEDEVLILFDNFKGKSLNEAQKVARSKVNNGADLVVGRGFEGIGPLENFGDGVIIYSLGDFITDSGLAVGTNLSSSGVVLGVTFDDGELEVYPFAVKIENGYPKLGDSSFQSTINSKLTEK